MTATEQLLQNALPGKTTATLILELQEKDKLFMVQEAGLVSASCISIFPTIKLSFLSDRIQKEILEVT